MYNGESAAVDMHRNRQNYPPWRILNEKREESRRLVRLRHTPVLRREAATQWPRWTSCCGSTTTAGIECARGDLFGGHHAAANREAGNGRGARAALDGCGSGAPRHRSTITEGIFVGGVGVEGSDSIDAYPGKSSGNGGRAQEFRRGVAVAGAECRGCAWRGYSTNLLR